MSGLAFEIEKDGHIDWHDGLNNGMLSFITKKCKSYNTLNYLFTINQPLDHWCMIHFLDINCPWHYSKVAWKLQSLKSCTNHVQLNIGVFAVLSLLPVIKLHITTYSIFKIEHSHVFKRQYWTYFVWHFYPQAEVDCHVQCSMFLSTAICWMVHLLVWFCASSWLATIFHMFTPYLVQSLTLLWTWIRLIMPRIWQFLHCLLDFQSLCNIQHPFSISDWVRS